MPERNDQAKNWPARPKTEVSASVKLPTPHYASTTVSQASKTNQLVETAKKRPRARKTFMDSYRAQSALHERFSIYKVQKNKKA